MKLGFSLLCLLFANRLCAQCPSVDFDLQATACINQSLLLNNQSLPAGNFYWDFCSGDLQVTPSVSDVIASSLIFRARVFRAVQSENGDWFGFAIDQPNNTLIRFDFGNSLDNTPMITNLGNPSSEFKNPIDIKFLREDNNWYALVANTGGDNLLLLDFGISLNSMPTVTNWGSLSGAIQAPGGISLVNDGNVLRVFVSNSSVAEMVALNLGGSILNTPSVSVFSVTGASGLRSISIIRECDQWFGLVTSYNNSVIYYLDFEDGLDQSPTVGPLAISGASYSFPSSIAIVNEGAEYFAFIQSAFPGNFYRISFGSSIIDRIGNYDNLGNLGISNDNGALEVVSIGSQWVAYTIDLSGVVTPGAGRLMKLSFDQPCNASIPIYIGFNPPAITYSGPGVNRVSLEVRDDQGAINHSFRTVTLGSLQAPDISLTSQNLCANHDINFTSESLSGGITDYNWDFGDTNTSMLENPIHQYTSAGEYEVLLNVTASNGCNNIARQNITIYNEPVPDFNLPAAAPICTNQEYFFTNNSAFDAGSNPIWQWEVNGNPVSTDLDLSYSISTSIQQDVKLIASIPGCSNEIMKSILTVEEGPLADFTFNNGCVETSILFTNTTAGPVTGYSWDFGDANVSSQTNGQNTYTGFGVYDVTLTASNAVGCNNSTTKPITIYSKPQPDFSIDLPPFSCSGSPSQFNDLTPNPTDSNLSGWTWSFGDPSNGTSTTRNPLYNYSNYQATVSE